MAVFAFISLTPFRSECGPVRSRIRLRSAWLRVRRNHPLGSAPWPFPARIPVLAVKSITSIEFKHLVRQSDRLSSGPTAVNEAGYPLGSSVPPFPALMLVLTFMSFTSFLQQRASVAFSAGLAQRGLGRRRRAGAQGRSGLLDRTGRRLPPSIRSPRLPGFLLPFHVRPSSASVSGGR